MRKASRKSEESGKIKNHQDWHRNCNMESSIPDYMYIIKLHAFVDEEGIGRYSSELGNSRDVFSTLTASGTMTAGNLIDLEIIALLKILSEVPNNSFLRIETTNEDIFKIFTGKKDIDSVNLNSLMREFVKYLIKDLHLKFTWKIVIRENCCIPIDEDRDTSVDLDLDFLDRVS